MMVFTILYQYTYYRVYCKIFVPSKRPLFPILLVPGAKWGEYGIHINSDKIQNCQMPLFLDRGNAELKCDS